MKNNNIDLSVVIQGQRGELVAREFVSPQDRQTYIEGREGSIFTLRIRNNNPARVLAIPSIDGLSVLDGKAAGNNSPGYVVEAYATLDIAGWVVDNDTAAKFYFSGLREDGGDESYVALSGQDATNKGVIGLKVFAEKPSYNNMAFTTSAVPSGGLMRGISKGLISPTVSSTTIDHSYSLTASNAVGGSLYNSSASFSDVTEPVEQTLGTGFGDATDFKTQKTEFKRGDLLAMMVMFYDDARGLKKRGIDVSRPIPRTPNAFPADQNGCLPPKGWSRHN